MPILQTKTTEVPTNELERSKTIEDIENDWLFRVIDPKNKGKDFPSINLNKEMLNT